MNKVYDFVYQFIKYIFIYLILSFILIFSGFFLVIPISLFIKYYFGEKYVLNVSIKRSFLKKNMVVSLLVGSLILLIILGMWLSLFSSSFILIGIKLIILLFNLFIVYSCTTTYCNYQVSNNFISIKKSFYVVYNNLKYNIVSFLMTFSFSILLFVFFDLFFVSYCTLLILVEYLFFKVYIKKGGNIGCI